MHEITVVILGSLIFLMFAIATIFLIITLKKKRYQDLLEKQQMENNYQNQLLMSRLEVQEQSFRYFSEEIHDNIGQLLSLVKMQLFSIKNSSKELDIVKKASDSTDLLGKAISDLRNISHTLNSSYVDKAGLEAAIRKDLDYICSARELHCGVYKTGEEYILDADQQLLIFRIVQEAINNALKHASPTEIDVFLDFAPGVFTVTVKDNGTGFDPDAIREAGLGLNNMHVRAALLRGNLAVSSATGGTEVKLAVAVEAST